MSMQIASSIGDADGIYQRLIDLHQGRTEAESMRLNARLILLLINQVGDSQTVLEAIARAGAEPAKKELNL
jgi:hypothetical protein